MICKSRGRTNAHCKFMQGFCLKEAPGVLVAGIFAGIFASELIHSWFHVLSVSNLQVTEASCAPGMGARCLPATSPHRTGVLSLINTISSCQEVSYGKISPHFPQDFRGPPSQRAVHTAERGWEDEQGLRGSSPGKTSTSGWMG